MNPWKIIGWIVLAFLLLWLYSCAKVVSNMPANTAPDSPAAYESPAVSTPTYSVVVVNFDCEKRSSYDLGKATVRNTGSTSIPFAKLFVEFLDSSGKVVATGDTFFSPLTIPVGATASAEVMEQVTGAASCRPSAMQDGDGNQITFTAAK